MLKLGGCPILGLHDFIKYFDALEITRNRVDVQKFTASLRGGKPMEFQYHVDLFAAALEELEKPDASEGKRWEKPFSYYNNPLLQTIGERFDPNAYSALAALLQGAKGLPDGKRQALGLMLSAAYLLAEKCPQPGEISPLDLINALGFSSAPKTTAQIKRDIPKLPAGRDLVSHGGEGIGYLAVKEGCLITSGYAYREYIRGLVHLENKKIAEVRLLGEDYWILDVFGRVYSSHAPHDGCMVKTLDDLPGKD